MHTSTTLNDTQWYIYTIFFKKKKALLWILHLSPVALTACTICAPFILHASSEWEQLRRSQAESRLSFPYNREGFFFFFSNFQPLWWAIMQERKITAVSKITCSGRKTHVRACTAQREEEGLLTWSLILSARWWWGAGGAGGNRSRSKWFPLGYL